MKEVIKIARKISNIISSRDVLSILRNEIKKSAANVVILDFADVQFISRSAAHELIELQQMLAEEIRFREIVLSNTSPDVSAMLRTVAANRVLPKIHNSTKLTPTNITLKELARQV